MKKTLIEITLFSPFVVKTQKREKSYEAKVLRWLLIVLCLLIIDGRVLIIIVVVIESMSETDAKSSELSRSQ
jgi:hypothetical protein